jgi:hypothetical protein
MLRPAWPGQLRMRALGMNSFLFPNFSLLFPDLCKIFHEYQHVSSQPFWNERLADKGPRHGACLE